MGKKFVVGLLGFLLIGFAFYGCGRVVEEAVNPNMSETPAVIPAGTSVEVSVANISVASDKKSISFNMLAVDQDNQAITNLTRGNIAVEVHSSVGSWTSVTTTDAPSARSLHTAVWTGSKMIVWGGQDLTTFFNTGIPEYRWCL